MSLRSKTTLPIELEARKNHNLVIGAILLLSAIKITRSSSISNFSSIPIRRRVLLINPSIFLTPASLETTNSIQFSHRHTAIKANSRVEHQAIRIERIVTALLVIFLAEHRAAMLAEMAAINWIYHRMLLSRHTRRNKCECISKTRKLCSFFQKKLIPPPIACDLVRKYAFSLFIYVSWPYTQFCIFLLDLSKKFTKKNGESFSLWACHPSRRGHANLLCIVPILTDDPFGSQ